MAISREPHYPTCQEAPFVPHLLIVIGCGGVVVIDHIGVDVCSSTKQFQKAFKVMFKQVRSLIPMSVLYLYGNKKGNLSIFQSHHLMWPNTHIIKSQLHACYYCILGQESVRCCSCVVFF